MIRTDALNEPAVRAFVTAVNAGDRDAFRRALTENATMSDDGSDHVLDDWADREIFDSHGHMDVQSQDTAGRTLIADYRNDTWLSACSVLALVAFLVGGLSVSLWWLGPLLRRKSSKVEI